MPLSNQEIFTKVVLHLRTQNRAARNLRGGCFYRAPNGAKCAVGGLIPDELYNPKMEGANVKGLLNFFPELHDIINLGNLVVLYTLQQFHDDDAYYNRNGMTSAGEPRLKQIAERYNLIYPEPKV